MYVLYNTYSTSIIITLTIRLHGVCSECFRRIFITWYFKEEINRRIDKIFCKQVRLLLNLASQMTVIHKNWHLLFSLSLSLIFAAKELHICRMLCLFKCYMVSTRRYFSISKYFLKVFPKHLPFFVGHILSKFAATIVHKFLNHIWDMGNLFLCPLTAYLNLPIHAATHLSETDIWCNVEIVEVLFFQKTICKFITFYEIMRILNKNWRYFR